ncbi:MAG TPA: cupin domain-containing protein [Herpetosiphonaceae bacterium]|nr:cupin domain-containing protein [Herpetosiphonaceae bacterium]
MSEAYVNVITAIEPLVAGDGCILRELLHPERLPVSPSYSLAHAYVEPGGRTADHWLEQSEVYYILSGQGTMFLGGVPHAVAAGSYFYIPGGMSQWLRNDGAGRIEFLCIVDPPWSSQRETISE